MHNSATTIDDYVAQLPEERKQAIASIRDVILRNLAAGYEEVIAWGMITYQVPISTFADTYNKQPLMYAGVANQKNHFSVYLNGLYFDASYEDDFRAAYQATGKRLDMGKSCLRFRHLEDVPLELIGAEIARLSVADFIQQYQKIRHA